MLGPAKNPKFGDFQSNAAMGLGKRVGVQPREVAQRIVDALRVEDLCEPVTGESIAGPGFINVRLRSDVLGGFLAEMAQGDGLGVADAGGGRRVVVDLCGVNLAKQMHVGHLRSIIIGDSVARVLSRLGWEVVRQNHVGDWGLPIAMVTRKLIDESSAGRVDLGAIDLDELERLYRGAKLECDADVRGLESARRETGLGGAGGHPKAVAELEEQTAGAFEADARAKATLVSLQSGDVETVRVWRRISEVTMRACLETCARLHADIDEGDSAGESSYAEELAGLVEDLVSRGVAEEDDGALIVRNDGGEQKGGGKQKVNPTLVRKRDGGYLYATTDLAGIRRRCVEMGASRVIYCVDARQADHFKQVFASAHRAGYARVGGGDEEASLEHAAFGTVLGEDGRPFKTRSGENVKLRDLLDEARERARAVVGEKSPELSARERDEIAEVVGIAAIKYADLSGDRVRDYVFSFERMLAFEGNTGPYLLYQLVRIRSIFRKAAERFGESGARGGPVVIGEKEEKDLALALLGYGGVVASVGETLEPHRLCQYLYELAGTFSGFFTRCPVLGAEEEGVRASRLVLCGLTERVLDDGLGLLGIRTLDRM